MISSVIDVHVTLSIGWITSGTYSTLLSSVHRVNENDMAALQLCKLDLAAAVMQSVDGSYSNGSKLY